MVLSNNDGCVISRSNEAKALGIPMGCPAFKISQYTHSREVIRLSGRHQLYYDISCRIMNILGQNVDNVEVYSVDEAFFKVPYDDNEKNVNFLIKLREKIYKYVGIPVSIGVAPTRTLTKIAARIAKKDASCSGVKILEENDFSDVLSSVDISDVWGIGRRLTASLQENGIVNAAQFAALPSNLVRKRYGVTVARTHDELLGIDCIAISTTDARRKSIGNSRTFATMHYKKNDVQDAVLHFALSCAKQLRSEGAVASRIMVYVRGDYFKEDQPFYSNSCQLRLATPTSDTLTLVNYAITALNSIFREGFGYRKAGVMVEGIIPANEVQLSLFDHADINKQKNLMRTVDLINRRFINANVILAPEVDRKKWAPRHEHNASQSKQLYIYSGMSRGGVSAIDYNEIE